MSQIGINCNRPDWHEFAIKVLLNSTSRRVSSDTRIEDACICHGSAGLALIYYYAWLNTGHDKFFETARYWLRITMDYAGENFEFLFKGLDGFESKNNLLEGSAGVGLVLPSMLEGHLPGWEKALSNRVGGQRDDHAWPSASGQRSTARSPPARRRIRLPVAITYLEGLADQRQKE